MVTKHLRVFNLFMAVLLVVGLFATAQPVTAKKALEIDGDSPYVPGEVVVGFTSTNTRTVAAQAAALAGTVDAQVVSQYGSLALLSFAEDADVLALSTQLSGATGVAFAEPNYIFGIPEQLSAPTRPEAVTEVTRGRGEEAVTVPVAVLKSLRSVNNGRITATYPNDPYLWDNWGWSYIGADILSGNLTVSKNVCVLDTGVDYTHPDLSLNIIKGLDFVNNDADPMDDNGHGTHVAGVIAAIRNNGKGIAGVSTGKVVAVKVLNAQGWGTNYGVASGINYCANRPDVYVLSMSLGGGYSTAVDSAVYYAVITKGKLLVAAAGNNNSSTPSYPAGLSTSYPNRVLAVGAIDNGNTSAGIGCRAGYSNYGSWVSVVAPGTDIFSTLPYNRPYYLGYYSGYGYYHPGYDYLSGTSMATPFVAAAAARRWGYKPLDTNAQVGLAVTTVSPWEVLADDSCWPASMHGIHEVNVAALLDRGAAQSFTYDATTGLPLTGATFQIYKGSYYNSATKSFVPGTLKGSGIVEGTFSGYAEVINLPLDSGLWGWTNFPGYTLGPQWTGWVNGTETIYGGWWTGFGRMFVPQKSANFTHVAGWDYGEDLDTNVWLPGAPNPLDPGQPAPFIIGPEGNSYGFLESDPTGTLLGFPFGIWNRDGGYLDWLPVESTVISNRKAHGTILANAALPYYPGTYWFQVTDYGQHDPIDGDPLLYDWSKPYSYMWKDGKILDMAYDYGCYSHNWYPWTLSSGTTGVATLTWVDLCLDSSPYATAGGRFEGARGGGVSAKP
jgi:subtilisin family serine protease